MKPVAFTSGQFGGRFTYIPNNPAAVLPNGMALYSEPSAMLLEAAEALKTLRNSLSQYDDGEWYLHDGCDPQLDYIDEILEKLK